MLTVEEYSSKYESDVKDLLVELQQYLTNLDDMGVLTVKGNFRDGYFNHVQKEIKENNGIIFVAERDGKTIGCIICKILCGGGESEFTTMCPQIGFISDLVVTIKERNRGVGKLLMKYAEEYFRNNDCEYIQLEVFAPNKNAYDLYRKMGFEDRCIYMSRKM